MTEKEVLPPPEGETTGDKGKDGKNKRKSKRNRTVDERLNRVIVRRLPPTMKEEDFMRQIDPIPAFSAFHFASPDWTLGIMASCRAYITFKDPDEVFVFRDKYDGYVFVDAKGVEYPAVVEYAPFQGFSKTRSKKRDVKMNTIEKDSHYIAFMEALKNAENEPKSEGKMEFSYQVKEDTEITSTPLLEYLESKKKEKIAEKKRKADEKKKKRDDERQARKKQVAKNIPEPIKEETKKDHQGKQETSRSDTKDNGNNKKKGADRREKSSQDKPTPAKVEPDDDGIMVRVVPSRLDRNQRKNKDDKEESRRDRDRDRKNSRRQGKNERPAEKTERTDRDRKDRNSSNKVKDKEETKTEVKPEVKSEVKTEVGSKTEVKESKREVKKYSERRKEIRARAENRRNEAEEKAVTLEQTPESLKTSSSLDVSAEPFVPGVKKPLESWVVKEGPPGTIDPFPKKSQKKDHDKADSHIDSESSAMENEKSDRQKLTKEEEETRRRERAERISNLRNKDRPSIAIYQPRRVRIAANFNPSDSCETKVKTPESDAKLEEEKQTRERKHSKEERRKSERRERKHHRSSGDEKSEKPIRHKKRSITENESREMSRQNSQASEVTESRHESGEEVEVMQEKEGTPSKSVQESETTETIVKAIEGLVIEEKAVEEVKEAKTPENLEISNENDK